MKFETSVVLLNKNCTQRCIFCSRDHGMAEHAPGEIKQVMEQFSDSISFEGGEPTLFAGLLRWVRLAKARKIKEIILLTNAARFSDTAYIKKLLKAGVTMFNVHLPAHDERIFDALTQTKGNFRRRVEAVKNLIRVAGGERVRLTLVVNSVIYRYLGDYADFVIREFPENFYVGVNFIKVMGEVTKRKWLVPKLSAVRPHLREMLRRFERGGVMCITDGFPLCALKDFETTSIDTIRLAHRAGFYRGDKMKPVKCGKCGLSPLCSGARKDYLAIYTAGELVPSAWAAGALREKIINRNRSNLHSAYKSMHFF